MVTLLSFSTIHTRNLASEHPYKRWGDTIKIHISGYFRFFFFVSPLFIFSIVFSTLDLLWNVNIALISDLLADLCALGPLKWCGADTRPRKGPETHVACGPYATSTPT